MKLSRKELLALGIIVGAVLITNLGIYFYRISRPDTSMAGGHEQEAHNSAATNAPATAARLFFFDPNSADSATFVSLGLRPNTARAIVHYRMAGGRFRKPDDFARIYTLSHDDFLRLRPYIRINKQYSVKDTDNASYRHYEAREDYAHSSYSQSHSSKEYDSSSNTQHPASKVGNYSAKAGIYSSKGYVRKLKQGERVDLSTADTLDLQRIPGIGPYYAAKIIRYRNRMGGFVSVNQLEEIYGLPDDICRWVSVGKPHINKIRINALTFGQLLKHPYLNFDQVKAILNHRQLYGPVRSLTDLRTYDAFSEDDFRRLAPYVDFD